MKTALFVSGLCLLASLAAAQQQIQSVDTWQNYFVNQDLEQLPAPTCVYQGDDSTARWRQDCNWCTCSPTGQSLCSRRECTPYITELLRDTDHCEGGAEWKDDCNWCRCADGLALCTRRACLGQQAFRDFEAQDNSISLRPKRQATSTTNALPEPTCVFTAGSHADRWREGCNWCTCSPTGLSLCTRIACSPQALHELQGESQCEGSARWKDDCNWCSCLNGHTACTLMWCQNGLSG